LFLGDKTVRVFPESEMCGIWAGAMNQSRAVSKTQNKMTITKNTLPKRMVSSIFVWQISFLNFNRNGLFFGMAILQKIAPTV